MSKDKSLQDLDTPTGVDEINADLDNKAYCETVAEINEDLRANGYPTLPAISDIL
jgi:hypothetical protein